MDEKDIEEAMVKLLQQPKSVEVDGQKVENQSLDDLISAAKYLASRDALKGRKCPLRITKMAAGGTIL